MTSNGIIRRSNHNSNSNNNSTAVVLNAHIKDDYGDDDGTDSVAKKKKKKKNWLSVDFSSEFIIVRATIGTDLDGKRGRIFEYQDGLRYWKITSLTFVMQIRRCAVS